MSFDPMNPVFSPPSPPDLSSDERAWVDRHLHLELRAIAEHPDAPERARQHARRVVEMRAEWEAAAKDRPESLDMGAGPAGMARLFDGPWMRPSDLTPTAAIEVRIGDMMHAAAPMRSFRAAVERGDLDGARRIAGALYEAAELRRRGDEAVVRACMATDGRDR